MQIGQDKEINSLKQTLKKKKKKGKQLEAKHTQRQNNTWKCAKGFKDGVGVSNPRLNALIAQHMCGCAYHWTPAIWGSDETSSFQVKSSKKTFNAYATPSIESQTATS